jgi:hypothetical protein
MEVNWSYIWAAMVINFLMVYIVPKVITKPTGIKVVDDAVLFLNSEKSFLLSSTLIVGLTVYLSHYWVDSQAGDTVSALPPKTTDKF